MKSKIRTNSEKCIIWGAGYCGGIALEAYGFDRVLCFGDSDPRNIGTKRWDKDIISYDQMIQLAKDDGFRIIVASEDFGGEMEQNLMATGIKNYDLFIPEYARAIVSDRKSGRSPLHKKYSGSVSPIIHSELQKFRDLHKNKRIFLVGNGPSLRVEDLDKLYQYNEICFGFNNIHSIFDRTKWRPDYYGIADYYGHMLNKKNLEKIPGIHFLWDLFAALCPEEQREENNYFFRYIRKGYSSEDMPEFSSDATKGMYLGYSSVYDIGLQMAAYMGASEIYLIGTDHYYPNKKGHEGNHFDGYLNNEEMMENRMVFYPVENVQKAYESRKVEKAFERAKQYSREHGFRIYNATRGGKLEVFEQTEFDELF